MQHSHSLSFLDQVSAHLIEQHGSDFNDVIIVLPSNRVRLYLLQSIQRRLNQNFFSPHFYSMVDLVRELSGGQSAFAIEQVLELFACYKRLDGADDSFTEFIKWAPSILKDMEDVDAAMADGNQVFRNLREVKEIENWSFSGDRLSEAQQSFIAFWNMVGEMHRQFTSWQDDHSVWTHGRMTRRAAESSQFNEALLLNKKVYFVGIASFSQAETALIKRIRRTTATEVLWDLDEYYVADTAHEAGGPARKFGIGSSTSWIQNGMLDSPKKIHLVESTTSMSQILAVVQEIESLPASELNQTCIVVAEESMLEPLIGSLGKLDVSVNLALGIPLNRTSPARWIQSLLRLRASVQRRGHYHAHFVIYLKLAKELFGFDSALEEVLKRMVAENWVYVDEKKWNEVKSGYPELTFLIDLLNASITPADLVVSLNEVLQHITSKDEFALTASRKIHELLVTMSGLLQRYDFIGDDQALRALFQMIAQREKIYYRGEPIDGLQVLSIHETRGIDFKHVFLLGCNEDNMPSPHVYSSFIPYDLRLHYGLSLPQDADAVYAYTLYRLFHRAESIRFYFATVSSDFKSAEQSRYITQIISEWIPRNSSLELIRQRVQTPAVVKQNFEYQNNEWVKKRLDELFAYGISPSAMNKYNQCKLDFYFRYIIGLGEEDEVEEQMSSATFGSIVHFVLEEFYAGFIDGYPNVQDFAELNSSLQTRLESAMKRKYKSQSTKYGFNYLAVEVAKQMLEKYIDYELSEIE
ncbi:MAG: PD-(D/E)XK nuclease family protein, partial [Flavobacteriales bacterium]